MNARHLAFDATQRWFSHLMRVDWDLSYIRQATTRDLMRCAGPRTWQSQLLAPSLAPSLMRSKGFFFSSILRFYVFSMTLFYANQCKPLSMKTHAPKPKIKRPRVPKRLIYH
jgi:hypothetical protein